MNNIEQNTGEGLFGDTIVATAIMFDREVKKGIYDTKIIDIKDSKDQEKYNQYINLIKKIYDREYFQRDFQEIGLKLCVEIFFEILTIIFGTDNLHSLTKDAEEFTSKVRISGTQAILDGMCARAYDPEKDESFFACVDLPGFTNISNIVCAVHEFIHFYVDKHCLDLTKKYYYQEILSIYAEKVATDYLENKLGYRGTIRKCEQTRFDCIKWQHVDHVNIIKEVESLVKQNPYLSHQIIEGEPYSVVFPKYKVYAEQLKLSYGIGYLYGENLFTKFLEDSKSIRIPEFFKGNIGIEDLLKYYGISASNKETYTVAQRKIKKMK